MPLNPSGIRAVAFDLDGTLIDTRLDFAAMRHQIGCPDGCGLLEYIDTLTDPTEVAAAHAVIERHEMAGAGAATWMPGAAGLLTELRRWDYPVAILTRNMRAAVDMVCRNLAIPVDVILTREDCKPKPDPEGLLSICAAFGIQPSELLYVGDFIYDLRTAHAAGALSCLYRYGRNHSYAAEADWVVDRLDELAEAFRAHALMAGRQGN